MSKSRRPPQLTAQEYPALRRACETHREELLVRLSGEVGLRASEIARLEPGDVEGATEYDRDGYFVTVTEPSDEPGSASPQPPPAAHGSKPDPGDAPDTPSEQGPATDRQPPSSSEAGRQPPIDSGPGRQPPIDSGAGRQPPIDSGADREQSTGKLAKMGDHVSPAGTRTAYMPPSVGHDFWQYVRSNDVADDEQVISIGARRIQMLVSDIGERAALDTGRSGLEAVTPSALRQFFARELLVSNGVDVRVVRAVGGWEAIDFLLEDLDPPTREAIARGFDSITGDREAESSRLTDLVLTLESVDEELIAASSRAEIDRRVCEQLLEAYRAVWILEPGHTEETVSLRAHAGESPDRFEGAASTALVRHALQTGQTMIAPDDPGPATHQDGRGLLGATPIRHGDTIYGVLVVRTDRRNAFEKLERTALAAVGRRIAFAITATERRLVLLGGTVLELGFEYSDETAPLVALSRTIDGSISLDGVVPGEEGTVLLFVDVARATADLALERATDQPGISGCRLIQRYDDGCRLELRLAGTSPIGRLLGGGASVTSLDVEDGRASLTCEVPQDTDVRSLHQSLTAEFPSIELRSKRERTTAAESGGLDDSLAADLSEKQRSVLEAAYHAGYFQWPRETTAEELADAIGISSPTLHNHMRKAEQTLMDALFAD